MLYLEELKAFAGPFMEGWHDMAHYTRVWKLAMKIHSEEGGDLEIIMAAVWLHDIGRKQSIKDHPAIGAQYARTFLPTIDFPAKKIEVVARAILVHDDHGGQRTKEEMIVYDADRLDCFTASGVLRCVLEPARTGRNPITGASVSTLPELLDSAAAYLKVADQHLNTEAARRIAQRYKELYVDDFLADAIREQALI